MTAALVAVSQELVELLSESRLKNRSLADQVRIALSIYLFQDGVISIGKAAELTGEPRITFELFLAEIGIPVVRYDVEDYERDLRSIALAKERTGLSRA
jgi:predicted HTH domain antitoxin